MIAVVKQPSTVGIQFNFPFQNRWFVLQIVIPIAHALNVLDRHCKHVNYIDIGLFFFLAKLFTILGGSMFALYGSERILFFLLFH